MRLREVVEPLEGQLTIALHVDRGDLATLARIIPLLELLAGRLLVNGFGTGVRFHQRWSMGARSRPPQTAGRHQSERWRLPVFVSRVLPALPG